MPPAARLIAPIGGRWWWAALAAVWTASTLLAWPLVHGDATLHLSFGTLAIPNTDATQLAKLATVAASALVLVIIGTLGRPSASSRLHGSLGLALALVFAAPTSQRWLQDATETGPLVAAAVLCGWAIDRWLSPAPASERVLVLGIAAALPVLLRIDAAPIGIATLLAARALDRKSWRAAVATTLAIVIPLAVVAWASSSDLDLAIAAPVLAWPPLALGWLNPWWLVGAVTLVLLAARRHALARLGVFGLLPLVASVWTVADLRSLIPALAFAWTIALVFERHTGALARRLDHPTWRRAWQLALALGLAHVVLTWSEMRARFAAIEIPAD